MTTKFSRARRHSISSLEEAKLAVETESFASRQSRKRHLDETEETSPAAKRCALLTEALSFPAGGGILNTATEEPPSITGGKERMHF